MKTADNKIKTEALVIVAHPDDETIWMGATILKNKEIDWTIFSLCRASDKDRAPKFFRVCANYGAKGIMANLEDEGVMKVAESVPVIKKLIAKNIGSRKFHYIFTHGANGEYGHPRHKGVNRAVREMVKAGELKSDIVFYFHYNKRVSKPLIKMEPKTAPDVINRLSSRQYNEKKSIVTDIYGFNPKGIDANLCTNPETFKIYINNRQK